MSASFGAGLLLLLLAVAAPSFLDPLAASTLAVLAAALALGALVGGVAQLAVPTRARSLAAGLVGAAVGALLGVFVRGLPSAPAWAPAAASVAGAVVLAAAFARHACGLGALAGGVALSLAAVLVVSVGRARQAPPPGRLVIVGLDGGTWRILDPLLAEGAMPATARVVRDGASGVLWSMEPSPSSVLWTTIATGRRPEEHGIHDFYATQNEQLRATRFWEVASARGETVGIFQWLITWPPDPLPGFIVPGWLARDARTQPPSLRFVKDVELRLQHRERPEVAEALGIAADAVANGLTFGSVAQIARDAAGAWRLGAERAWYRAGKYAQLALHGDVFLARYRADAPAVAAVVFYGSDALSHAYWKFHEPAAYPDVGPEDVRLYGDTLREYYRRFDRMLARLLETVGPDTTVLVVSDHGFHAAQDRQLTVHTDPLLEVAGARPAFTAHAINRQVYLTHRHAGTPEAAADVARVAATLGALEAGGTRLLDVEPTAGERVTVELRRDALGVPGDATITGGARPLPLASLLAHTTWSGSHENQGILLAIGPGIRPGRRIDGAHVLDVTPTILAILGYPIADDMDGRVLVELFGTPPALTRTASYDGVMPQRVATAGAPDAGVEERLRVLGYVR